MSNIKRCAARLFRPAGLLLLSCVFAAEGVAQQRPAPAKPTRSVVDASLPEDPETARVIAPYVAKVRALDEVIGQLSGELEKRGVGAGTLGNFVTDAMRARGAAVLGRPVLLAITNGGGLRRSTIAAGTLRARDIFELTPFENALVTVDLSGEQLRRFLQTILAQRDAQSGATITYRESGGEHDRELIDVKLGPQRRAIDPRATYTIVTIDYLVKRGGDYAVLQESKNVRPVGLTLRDAIIDYVKGETAANRAVKSELDGRFDRVESTTAAPATGGNQ